MERIKKEPRVVIVLEEVKGKQVNFHTLYTEKDAQRREDRLTEEGWTTRRLPTKSNPIKR